MRNWERGVMGKCVEVHKCWVFALGECEGRRAQQIDDDREQRDDG